MLCTAPPDFRPDFRAALQLAELTRRASEAIAAAAKAPIHVQSAWPTLLTEEMQVPHGPGIAVHLALSPSPMAARLVLWLEAPLAIAIVERMLGGSGAGAVAHRAINLHTAEQGVLAYAATKACQAFRELRVTDVTADFPRGDPGILLSFSVDLGSLRSAVHCFWLDGTGPHAATQFDSELRLWLNEDLDDAELLALASGDVLCFLHSRLHEHHGQLWGTALTSFDGSEVIEHAVLEGKSMLRGRTSLAASQGRIRIELGRQRVSFEQLARFGAGQAVALEHPWEELTLTRAEEVVARGEFVRYRGQVAIRITAR